MSRLARKLLWERVQEGNAEAFAQVFDEYSGLIYNVAFRRTGSWDAAEEIVSLVFLEAWRQRATITAYEGSIRPWLLGVTLNLVRRHWRRADRQHRASLKLVSGHDQLDHASDVAEHLDAEKAMSRILDSLQRMPEEQREVVQLWAWEELTYEEIAAVLDIPIGTVKSRLHRARDALRKSDEPTGTERESRDTHPPRTFADRRIGGEGAHL